MEFKITNFSKKDKNSSFDEFKSSNQFRTNYESNSFNIILLCLLLSSLLTIAGISMYSNERQIVIPYDS